MPEVRIEKQEVGRDIYNIVIHHQATGKKINLLSIQSVLRTGEISEGEFFRKEPAWVDFEQGFIVERKEVDEIINNLENKKVQLVLGAPASGKSIILKLIPKLITYISSLSYVNSITKKPYTIKF